MLHLDDSSTMAEHEDSIFRLKARNAEGLSGILSKMVLCGGPVLLESLLVLMQAVWREGCVLKNWRDALIVPFPKKAVLQ